MRLTISRIRDKFEADDTVQNVHSQQPGRLRTSTKPTRSQEVLDLFLQTPRKSVRQAARETLIKKSSVHNILKRGKWKRYIPKLVQTINQDDYDRRIEFCE